MSVTYFLLLLLFLVVINTLVRWWCARPSAPTIVHLVLCSDRFPYRDMMNITKEWYATCRGVTTLYYWYERNLPQRFVYEPDRMLLRIRGDETYVPGILMKTLDALEFVLSTFPGAQMIVRTNVSTIVDFPLLLQQLPLDSVRYGGYMINELAWLDPSGGVVDETWFGTRYASGTCIFMDRTLASDMTRRRHLFRTNLVDDLSIGVWMREHAPGIPIWSADPSAPNWFYRHRQDHREQDIERMQHLVRRLKSNERHKSYRNPSAY